MKGKYNLKNTPIFPIFEIQYFIYIEIQIENTINNLKIIENTFEYSKHF